MRHSQVQEPIRRDRVAYIDTRWRGIFDFLKGAENRILSYLFILNTGGLAASLTYIAAKPSTPLMRAAILSFTAGVVFILLHATYGYYRAKSIFSAYRNDVQNYFDDKLDWEVLTDRDNARSGASWIMETLGWLSGLTFLVGLVCGFWGLSF